MRVARRTRAFVRVASGFSRPAQRNPLQNRFPRGRIPVPPGWQGHCCVTLARRPRAAGAIRWTLCPTKPTAVPGDVAARFADATGHQLAFATTKNCRQRRFFEDGGGSLPSTHATHMARAYPEAQPAGPTTLEVVWQRRPRMRQIPVHFITSPPPQADPPRPAAVELTWLPRHESTDPQGQS